MNPGDVGFSHTTGLMGRLIRVGEFLRFRKGSDFNHAFIVSDKTDANGEHLAIQATLKGVTADVPVSQVAPGGKTVFVSLPEGVDPKKVLAFANNQVGLRYGYFTILAIAIDILTWQWFPSFRGARKPSWICSALVMESLRYGGFLHNAIDIYTITPAEAFDILT